MAVIRQCPDCGKQYTSKARFCRVDGARLVDAPEGAAPLEPRPEKPDPRKQSHHDLRPVAKSAAKGPTPSGKSTGSAPGETAAKPRNSSESRRDSRRDSKREIHKPEAKRDPMLGRVIAGRFQLEAVIGAGATGVVYKATHRALGRTMAVKLLKPQFVWDERSLQRFLREARTCSLLDHPNIVYLYDFGRDGLGEPYLVMEFAEGETLHDVIQRSPTRTLPIERTYNVLVQAARALEHAHSRGVIHRDIKPENIMLTKHEGQVDWVKILDFGVARIVGQAPVTGHGQVTGTAEFIAPETLIGDGIVAPPGDLYALGIIFHDALVGRPPFTGKLDVVLHQHMHVTPPLLSERSGDPNIPPELDALVARLLGKDPEKRPTAAELVLELEQLQMQSWLSEIDGAVPEKTAGEETTQRMSMHQRSTTVMPTYERKTELNDRLGRPTQIVDRLNWPTQMMPNLAHIRPSQEVERPSAQLAEAQIDEAEKQTEALHKAAVKLATTLWAGGWPQALINLRQHIDSCEEQARQLSTALSSHDEAARKQVTAQRRHQTLRQQILAVSERLRSDQPIDDLERGRLYSELENLERAFFTSDPLWHTNPPTRGNSQPLRQRLLDVRATRRRARILFARLLISMPCPAIHEEARAAIAKLVSVAEQHIK